jgi:outer membrane protein assembly factor BamB
MKLPCAILLLACVNSLQAAAPNWPQFRGPNAAGVAEESRPPVEFGPDTNLLWKTEVPSGLSSPCVWGDHIFLTAAEEGKPVTLAVNRRDGKILWRQSVAGDAPREIHKKNHPATATPATDGKSVCVYHAGFGLIAYDFGGRELWSKLMPGLLVRNGSGTSPALLDGRLVLNCDVEEGKSFLAAFDPATGRECWRTSRAQFLSGYTTPIRWQRGNRDEAVVVGSLRVTGYNLSDGRERWAIGGTEAVSVAPTPVVGDGLLYVMSRSMSGAKLPPWALFALGTDKDADGKISRDEVPKQFIEQGMFSGLDRDQDGFVVEKEWNEAMTFFQQADYGLFALQSPGEGEMTTNHVVWKHKKGVASVSSPLFYRGRIYVAQDGGRVTCFDAKSGRKFFEQERVGADGDYYASPIAANGHVYVSSGKGKVTVIEAGGDTLVVKARNDVGEPIYATPAIVEDKLYVRSQRHLWAFGRKGMRGTFP